MTTDAAILAAYAFVERTPSDGRARAPYWHGWALREAFLAGAAWQQGRALDVCRRLVAGHEQASEPLRDVVRAAKEVLGEGP